MANNEAVRATVERIEGFFNNIHDFITSFEMSNLHDDSVFYACVFLVAFMSLFVLYTLGNFYLLRPGIDELREFREDLEELVKSKIDATAAAANVPSNETLKDK
jgi:hypothetical protein